MNKLVLYLFIILNLHLPQGFGQITYPTPDPSLPQDIRIEKGGIVQIEQHLKKNSGYQEGMPFSVSFFCERPPKSKQTICRVEKLSHLEIK